MRGCTTILEVWWGCRGLELIKGIRAIKADSPGASKLSQALAPTTFAKQLCGNLENILNQYPRLAQTLICVGDKTECEERATAHEEIFFIF